MLWLEYREPTAKFQHRSGARSQDLPISPEAPAATSFIGWPRLSRSSYAFDYSWRNPELTPHMEVAMSRLPTVLRRGAFHGRGDPYGARNQRVASSSDSLEIPCRGFHGRAIPLEAACLHGKVNPLPVAALRLT